MAAPLVAAAAKAAGKAIAKGAAKKAAGSDSGKKAIRVGCMAAAGVVILPVFLFLAVLSALINALMQQPPGCANTGSSSGPEVAALAAYSLNVAGVNDADKITVMIAIADAESGLVGDKIGPGNASGLWQITPAQYPQGFPPAQSDPNFILDPANNAIAAVYRTGGPGLPNLSVWTGNAAYDAFAKGGGVTTDSKGNTTINWSVAKTFNDPAGSFQKARDAVAAASTTPGASPSAAPAGGCCGGSGSTGGGTGPPLAGVQRDRARIVIGVAKTMNLPQAAMVIAVMTVLTESSFTEYANSNVPASLGYPHDAVGSDHGSVGIFQQQVNPDGSNFGWGTLDQEMNPATGIAWQSWSFLHRIPGINGWQSMQPGVVAQTIQVSAFPDRYQTHYNQAVAIVSANMDAPAVPLPPGAGGGGGGGSGGGASCSGSASTQAIKSAADALDALNWMYCQPAAGYSQPSVYIAYPGNGVCRSPGGMDCAGTVAYVLQHGGLASFKTGNSTSYMSLPWQKLGSGMYPYTASTSSGVQVYTSSAHTFLVINGKVFSSDTYSSPTGGPHWRTWNAAAEESGDGSIMWMAFQVPGT